MPGLIIAVLFFVFLCIYAVFSSKRDEAREKARKQENSRKIEKYDVGFIIEDLYNECEGKIDFDKISKASHHKDKCQEIIRDCLTREGIDPAAIEKYIQSGRYCSDIMQEHSRRLKEASTPYTVPYYFYSKKFYRLSHEDQAYVEAAVEMMQEAQKTASMSPKAKIDVDFNKTATLIASRGGRIQRSDEKFNSMKVSDSTNWGILAGAGLAMGPAGAIAAGESVAKSIIQDSANRQHNANMDRASMYMRSVIDEQTKALQEKYDYFKKHSAGFIVSGKGEAFSKLHFAPENYFLRGNHVVLCSVAVYRKDLRSMTGEDFPRIDGSFKVTAKVDGEKVDEQFCCFGLGGQKPEFRYGQLENTPAYVTLVFITRKGLYDRPLSLQLKERIELVFEDYNTYYYDEPEKHGTSLGKQNSRNKKQSGKGHNHSKSNGPKSNSNNADDEKINRLKVLRNNGIIDEDEYNKRMKKLMEGE